MKRLEVCGGRLPSNAKKWLEANSGRFDTLTDMKRDEGLLAGRTEGARIVASSADNSYDDLSGDARLQALEASSPR